MWAVEFIIPSQDLYITAELKVSPVLTWLSIPDSITLSPLNKYQGYTVTNLLLVEEFASTENGWIPDADLRIQQIETANSGDAIGVSIHFQDSMEVLPPLGTTEIITEYTEPF